MAALSDNPDRSTHLYSILMALLAVNHVYRYITFNDARIFWFPFDTSDITLEVHKI